MKANELRIGNIFQYTHDEKLTEENRGKYEKILADDIVFIEECPNIDYIEPIPLTPEIMKKCLNHKEGFYYHNQLRGHFVVLNLDGKIYAEYFIGAYSICKIEYLHQLQNLVFALTNEELPINLQP